MRSKKRLTKAILVSLGIPAVFVPGLILASILGWQWQKDLSRLAQKGGFYQSETLFPKTAVVEEVVDGDTVELENGRTIRLVGVDAPNRGEDFYGQALEETIKLVEGKQVDLEYDWYQDDKFGRILAYLWTDCPAAMVCQDGRLMINQQLVKDGLAKVVIYEKRKKLKYQDQLLQTEGEAKEKHLGVWGR